MFLGKKFFRKKIWACNEIATTQMSMNMVLFLYNPVAALPYKPKNANCNEIPRKSQKENPQSLSPCGFLMVAEAGFEPTTFGL